jgi:DNA-binding response OmpR family regulator
MYAMPALGVSTTVGVRDDGAWGSEVLLVDDDQELLDLLAFLVEQAGLIPLLASKAAGALELFEKKTPSVAVVDLNIQPSDGFELLAELRRRSATLPIIVLTGRNNEDDKVRALDLGADDYVLKPFGHRELVARIRSQARRSEFAQPGKVAPAVLEAGPLQLDLRERILRIDGEARRLTGTEFRLLECLMRRYNSVVPTAVLTKRLWGYDDAPARDAVRVTAHRLRRKLGDDGVHRRLIYTLPGVGLKLMAD